MSNSDILEAFQRYCHPEVVSEFQQLGPEHQQVWLDTFWATCRNQVAPEACGRAMLESFRANPPTQDPREIDFDSRLKQMQRSSTASSGSDSCPLLRALKPHIKLDQSLWEDLLGPLRQDVLPSWGKKRSRQELEKRHQMGLLHTKNFQESLRQNSDFATLQTSDATNQKPMATMKPWTSLKPSLFADLPVLMVAEGKKVNCRVIDDPFVRTAVQALVEDPQGQVMPLQLYNQLPEGGTSLDEVMSKFAKGTELCIAEPFLKIMKDGYRGIRVDAPSDVRVSSELPDSDMTSLKTAGNSAFSKGQFDLAKEKYMAALQLVEVDEIAILLANRAQALLELDPVEACKDASATLLLRPAHQKAGLRYAAALQKCAEHLAEEGGEEHRSMLLLAKRAATLYPTGAHGAKGDQSNQGVTTANVKHALAILLAGFEDGLKLYQNRADFQLFGETAAQCREEANHQYKAGDKLKAISGYTLGLGKVGCAKNVAILLSNLSEVCLRLRESHNAMAFALAATRFGLTELFGKLLSRTCRAFEQLGEEHLAVKLAESISEDAACKQACKEFSRLPAEQSFRTRVYTNGRAEVLFDGTASNVKPVHEFVHQGIKTVRVAGKGRGVVATESMESGELLIVAYALSLAVAAQNEIMQITSGKACWQASQAKLIGRLAYCASGDNEVTWLLSQLCEKPEETKATVQPHELTGLSPRWMPLLGQQHCYYPPCDRVFLAKPTIDSIVLINSHGSHQAEFHQGTDHSGIFPSACLFNHSSDANCEFASVKLRDGSKVPEILAVMTIRAVREGEELNVCYSQEMHAENVWGIRES